MTSLSAEAQPPRVDAGAESRRPDVINLAVLVLVAVVVTLLGTYRAPSLSAFDEASHVDYTWAVAHGRVPYAGATIAPEVLAEWSCRSQDNIPLQIPPCGQESEPGGYPARGESYNYGHPPLYYALTAVAVRAVEALPVDLSFITTARLTGALWLAAALVGLYLVLRAWGLPRGVSLASGLLLAAAPSVAHAASIVTNDAPAVLSGVLALWVVTRVVVRRSLGWVQPTVLAAAVAATKTITGLVMILAAGVVAALAVRAWREGRRTEARRLGLVVTGVVLANAVVYLAWRAFQAGRAVEGWTNPVLGVNTSPADGFPLAQWAPTLVATFGITHDFWVQVALSSAVLVGSAGALSVLLTAAPFLNLAVFPARDPRRLLGWMTFLGALAFPLVVQVHTLVGDGHYFRQVTARYAMSLLPATIAALALVVVAVRWRVAYAVVAGGALAVLLLSFAGVL